MKTFEFTHIKEGIGSTHQGFLEHIPRTSGVINTSLKAEHVRQGRGYNFPNALCIRGRTSKVIEYEGLCRIKANKGSDGAQGI